MRVGWSTSTVDIKVLYIPRFETPEVHLVGSSNKSYITGNCNIKFRCRHRFRITKF